MWLEELLILLLLVGGGVFIGAPVYKFLKQVTPKKRNALAEAKERLEQARLDAEAAHLNKEAEKIYEEMYEDSLQEEEKIQEKFK